MPYLRSVLQTAVRLDVIFDTYRTNSLKTSTREKRGKGVTCRVQGGGRLPLNWKLFLRSNRNKIEICQYIAKYISSAVQIDGKYIICTIDNKIIAYPEGDYSEIEPCNHEEADSRIFLHIKDSITRNKVSTCLIRTVDTDVVVLAIHMASQTGINVFVAIGMGEHFRIIPAHSIAKKLGTTKSKALLLFHSITGCDTTSYFNTKGKKTCWSAWDSFEDITPVFIKLTEDSKSTVDADIAVIERFVIRIYDKNSPILQINDARLNLFAHKTRQIENIPPTQGALIQHTLRAILQARIWYQMTSKTIQEANPTEFGWVKTDNSFKPRWSNLPDIGKSRIFITCGCSKKCQGRCSCKREGLSCSEGCACRGKC